MNCVHCGDRKAMVCTQCEQESFDRINLAIQKLTAQLEDKTEAFRAVVRQRDEAERTVKLLSGQLEQMRTHNLNLKAQGKTNNPATG